MGDLGGGMDLLDVGYGSIGFRLGAGGQVDVGGSMACESLDSLIAQAGVTYAVYQLGGAGMVSGSRLTTCDEDDFVFKVRDIRHCKRLAAEHGEQGERAVGVECLDWVEEAVKN